MASLDKALPPKKDLSSILAEAEVKIIESDSEILRSQAAIINATRYREKVLADQDSTPDRIREAIQFVEEVAQNVKKYILHNYSPN